MAYLQICLNPGSAIPELDLGIRHNNTGTEISFIVTAQDRTASPFGSRRSTGLAIPCSYVL